MNIGLSIEHLHGKKTGVGQYGFNLALNLAKIDNNNRYFLFSPSPLQKGDLDRLSAYPHIKVLDQNVLESYISNDVILIPLWLHLYLPHLCKKTGVDLFLNTGSIWPLLPFRLAKRQLVFIHDVIPLLFPECYYKHTRYYYRLSRAIHLNTYDEILVNSETTKRDLVYHLGVNQKRIYVTPLGRDDRFMRIDDLSKNQRVRKKYGLPESYLLFTGTLEPRKNITGLLEAYGNARARESLKLVITGKKGWLYKEIFETVKQLNLTDRVVFTGFADDDDLPSIYSMAKVFVYPSLYEGFGLPVLEAMACGVPVITSHMSSLREVTGEAAILVDPQNVEALAKSIDDIVFSTKENYERLSRASVARAAKFTWEKTAQQTLAVLFG
ncbi:MAG: glycosyltransferase family 4 protein [Deltaproteobacteria bacterium]|nr:glycosyltransferase family 4 protein [Deltaproteobacteria bacterium]